MKLSKQRLIEKITTSAMFESMQSCNGSKRLPLRERDLPGRAIMKLDEDEREVLKTCKAKDFSWRGFK